jgi:hypothetical protein
MTAQPGNTNTMPHHPQAANWLSFLALAAFVGAILMVAP